MTTFKMPEPTLHESGPTDYFGRLLCYTEEDMKNALRDVLDQAAQVCESDYRVLVARRAHADSMAIGGANFAYFNEVMGRLTACATEIRAMKEQIK